MGKQIKRGSKVRRREVRASGGDKRGKGKKRKKT